MQEIPESAQVTINLINQELRGSAASNRKNPLEPEPSLRVGARQRNTKLAL